MLCALPISASAGRVVATGHDADDQQWVEKCTGRSLEDMIAEQVQHGCRPQRAWWSLLQVAGVDMVADALHVALL